MTNEYKNLGNEYLVRNAERSRIESEMRKEFGRLIDFSQIDSDEIIKDPDAITRYQLEIITTLQPIIEAYAENDEEFFCALSILREVLGKKLDEAHLARFFGEPGLELTDRMFLLYVRKVKKMPPSPAASTSLMQ